MVISDLIEVEKEHYRTECNFTPEELDFFNYRASGTSIDGTLEPMHISRSKATNLSKTVRRKIKRVDEARPFKP